MTAVAALATSASTGLAQDSALLDVQVHAGKGDGYVSSMTYGVDLAANATQWIAIQAGLARWHPSSGVGCVGSWPSSYRCTFKGHSATFVVRLRAVRVERVALFGAVGIGWFRHSDNTIRDTNTAVPL